MYQSCTINRRRSPTARVTDRQTEVYLKDTWIGEGRGIAENIHQRWKHNKAPPGRRGPQGEHRIAGSTSELCAYGYRHVDMSRGEQLWRVAARTAIKVRSGCTHAKNYIWLSAADEGGSSLSCHLCRGQREVLSGRYRS